jgi:hypothetical protein
MLCGGVAASGVSVADGHVEQFTGACVGTTLEPHGISAEIDRRRRGSDDVGPDLGAHVSPANATNT